MPQVKRQLESGIENYATDLQQYYVGIPAILNKPILMSNVPGVVLVAMPGKPQCVFQKVIGPNGNHQPYFRRDINTLAVGFLLIQGELNM